MVTSWVMPPPYSTFRSEKRNTVEVRCVILPGSLCLCLGKSARKMNLRTESVSPRLRDCAKLSAFAHAVPAAHPVTPTGPLRQPRQINSWSSPQTQPRGHRLITPAGLLAHSQLNHQCPPSWCSINIYGMNVWLSSSSRDQKSRINNTHGVGFFITA